MSKLIKRAGLGLAAAACLATPFAAPSGALAATPGQVCQVKGNAIPPGWSVWVSLNYTYYLNWPDHVRIDGYLGEWYLAHGNGKPSGYLLRVAVNQGTCS